MRAIVQSVQRAQPAPQAVLDREAVLRMPFALPELNGVPVSTVSDATEQMVLLLRENVTLRRVRPACTMSAC